MARLPSLATVLTALRKLHGKPEAPPTDDPFELILYENVAYLANDARRAEAFAILRDRVGLSPEKILQAPREVLLEITRRGISAEEMAERLREIASIALEDFGGDVGAAARRAPKEAIRAMKRFPSIGEPGAEKVLLFSGNLPVLALDSNGLRVLTRLGYAREENDYSKQYRAVRKAVDPEVRQDIGWLIEAHQLLRRHGQELCKRSHPRCDVCPLRPNCAYGRTASG